MWTLTPLARDLPRPMRPSELSEVLTRALRRIRDPVVRVMRAERIIATVHVVRTADGTWLADRIVRCSDADLGI